MKLAEGLQIRSDLQKRIRQLRVRLNNNATVQEGEQPAENPQNLLAELDQCITELQNMIKRINHTNASTIINGQTITDLLAQRDCMQLKIQCYRDFLDEASALSRRITHTEIKILSTVPVANLQKNVDQMSQELRQLDLKIQGLNWTTDLL